MADLAIIADDLTGALDSAAPFAMRGMRTVVALSAEAIGEAIGSGARIVSISTDSREGAPEAARAAVARAIAALPKGIRLFKKVDSRLKGNIEAELDAMPHQRSLAVPAIPAFGRLARQGRIEGFGVEAPIDIAARLGRHALHALIPDITSQADIETVLDLEFELPIGARGLAEALAGRMAPEAVPPTIARSHARTICVIGSTDPITLAQIEVLRAERTDMDYIAAPDGTVPDRPVPTAWLSILQAIPGGETTESRLVAKRLGEGLMRLAPGPGTRLILSGGATAQAVLGQMGIGVLELIGEALAGLPIARANGLTVITKSGGFGEPQTLLRLFDRLEATEPESVQS